MTTERLIFLLTIAVLFVIILFDRGCISKSNTNPIPKGDTTIHIIKKDSAQLQANVVKVYYPKFIQGENTISNHYDTVLIPAVKLTKSDSLQIVKNYLI